MRTVQYTYGASAGFCHKRPLRNWAWSTLKSGSFIVLTTVSDISTLFSFDRWSSTINRAILAKARSCSAWNRHVFVKRIDKTIAPISPECPLCNHYYTLWNPRNLNNFNFENLPGGLCSKERTSKPKVVGANNDWSLILDWLVHLVCQENIRIKWFQTMKPRNSVLFIESYMNFNDFQLHKT